MEDFVTFEQSIKLKKLGFDWECNHYYQDNNQSLHPNFYRDFNKHDKLYTDDEELKKVTLSSAPTLAQTQKWLREVKKIYVFSDIIGNPPRDKCKYYWHVETNNSMTVDSSAINELSLTYEQALSSGIDKAIEILKENGK